MSGTIKPLFICPTQCFTVGDATVTRLLDLDLAGLTGAVVTHLKAGVLATVQQGGARFLAAQQRSLAAAHRLTDLPTDTRLCYKGRTLWTRSRMAQNVTGMVTAQAAPFLAAHVAAAVWNLAALPLRVRHFTAEAGVGGGMLQGDVLAGGATPAFSRVVCLRGRRPSPFLYAVEVEDVETALAAPHGRHEPDDVAANHALVLLLRQLLDQTACLGLFALWHLVPFPLAGSEVLLVCSSPPSGLRSS